MTTNTEVRDWTRKFGRIGAWATIAAAIVTVISACNTTEGIGRDVESAGAGIEERGPGRAKH